MTHTKALEEAALTPMAIEFLVEIPVRILVEDWWLQERFGIAARDFLENPKRIRELAPEISEAVFAETRKCSLRGQGIEMLIAGASGIMSNKTKLDIDIEECGLGESKV